MGVAGRSFRVGSRHVARTSQRAKHATDKIHNVVIESKPLVAPATASNVLFSKKEKGLRYNIPALGTVTVWQSGEAPERLLNVQLPFGQLGSVGFLPVSTGSKKLRQEIALDPTTGALLSVKNVTSAFDPQSINKTGAASANILDAYKP